jgi:hypothetical protein
MRVSTVRTHTESALAAVFLLTSKGGSSDVFSAFGCPSRVFGSCSADSIVAMRPYSGRFARVLGTNSDFFLVGSDGLFCP